MSQVMRRENSIRRRTSDRDQPASGLRWRFTLLLIAVLCSGVYEVIDNILGLRSYNFESSAPIAFKVAKEGAILWIVLGMFMQVRRNRVTRWGIAIALVLMSTLIPQVAFLPTESFSMVGLLYFVASIVMLSVCCSLDTSDERDAFATRFLTPFLLICLATQLGEALLAPTSIYGETNLLGLDRRAGIAVIPTTAGVLGVVGVLMLRQTARLIAVLVVLMANSSLSLICLALALGMSVRPRAALILAVPIMLMVGVWTVGQREQLRTSAETRLDILADSLGQLRLFRPSDIGAASTAKSVALAPHESYIADSMYIEVLHVMGIVPGVVLLAVLFMLIYRRAGARALAIFAVAGIGFLIIEAWILWFALLCGFGRIRRVRTGPTEIEPDWEKRRVTHPVLGAGGR